MEVTRRRIEGNVSYEDLWAKLANRAMGVKRKRSRADYPQTAWDLIRPLLAKGWYGRAELKRITCRDINASINAHMGLLEKRGKYSRVEYRLKAKP